jgi:hypothetical protein
MTSAAYGRRKLCRVYRSLLDTVSVLVLLHSSLHGAIRAEYLIRVVEYSLVTGLVSLDAFLL